MTMTMNTSMTDSVSSKHLVLCQLVMCTENKSIMNEFDYIQLLL